MDETMRAAVKQNQIYSEPDWELLLSVVDLFRTKSSQIQALRE